MTDDCPSRTQASLSRCVTCQSLAMKVKGTCPSYYLETPPWVEEEGRGRRCSPRVVMFSLKQEASRILPAKAEDGAAWGKVWRGGKVRCHLRCLTGRTVGAVLPLGPHTRSCRLGFCSFTGSAGGQAVWLGREPNILGDFLHLL